MSAKSEQTVPITLRPRRWKTVLMLLVSLGFVSLGTVLNRDGRLAGWLATGFFALCAVVFAIQIHPCSSFLLLEKDGFTVCPLFRSQKLGWDRVREFGVAEVGLSRLVGWNFVAGPSQAPQMRAVSKKLAGYEGVLPDTYGMTAGQLAEIMETRRMAAVGVGAAVAAW